MITRPSRGGFCTSIPNTDDPDVFLWAATENDAERMAHSANMRHLEAMEQESARKALEQARLAAEFARQQWAAFRKIRARA